MVAQAFFKTAKHIACYLPFREEIDTIPLIQKIVEANKKCYLPLLDHANKKLLFAEYKPGDALITNNYGILEPLHTAKKIIPEALDVVLMPLLAVDRKGHRLGSGGGFYDRTFSFLAQQLSKKPLLIGYAYAIQLTDELPSEPWDIALDGVVTEENFQLSHQ